MALRWDLKPLFPNAPEDSGRALWTRRSAISRTAALGLLLIATWDVQWWQFLLSAAAVWLAADSGAMRVPFVDDAEAYEAARRSEI